MISKRYHAPARPVSFLALLGQSDIKPLVATWVMLAMLGTQVVLPLRMVLAADAPAASAGSGRADRGQENGAGSKTPGQRVLLARNDSVARVTASVANSAGAIPDVSFKKLDLSRTPTQQELIRSGGLGGPLSPLKSADVDALAQSLDNDLRAAGFANGLSTQAAPDSAAGKVLAQARAKVQRLKDMNLSFGRAIEARNLWDFPLCAQLMAQHLQKYPDSPWAGEAMLHLGIDAQKNGRFDEAQARFKAILAVTSDKPGAPTYEMCQKTKVAWTDMSISLGQWSDAHTKLSNIMATEIGWRRRTWAAYSLHDVEVFGQAKSNRLACGPQALSAVFASLGRAKVAARLAVMQPAHPWGSSLADLRQIADHYGVSMRGFIARPEELASLPQPMILHFAIGSRVAAQIGNYAIDGAAIAPTKGIAAPPLPACCRPLAPVETAGKKLSCAWCDGQSKTAQARHIREAAAAPPFRAIEAGHFLVVRRIDAAAQKVYLVNPQQGQPYVLTYAQLAKEWSGYGLCLARHTSALQAANPAPSRPQAVRAISISGTPALQPGQPMAPPRLAWLSTEQMRAVRGGCCCNPSAPGGPGPPPGLPNSPPPTCPTCPPGAMAPAGSPAIHVNPVTLNSYIGDTPLWYHSPLGPDFQIRLNYNSSASLGSYSPVGDKWQLGYGSYLYALPGGQVTINMPDSSQEYFYPNTSGGFTALGNVHDTLTATGANHFVLTSPQGDSLVYDLPTHNGTPLETYFSEEVAQTDRFGNSLNFDYEDLTLTTGVDVYVIDKVTDALGKVSQFTYNSAGLLTRVTDPFGRFCQFGYNSNSELISVVDMGGNSFSYQYDTNPDGTTTTTDWSGAQVQDAMVTQLHTVQGTYTLVNKLPYRDFYIPGPDVKNNNEIETIITDPLSQTETYNWINDGQGNDAVHYTDKNGNETLYYPGVVNNGVGQINTIRWSPIGTSHGYEGDIVQMTYDPLTNALTSYTDEWNHTTTIARNSMGLPTTITDAKGNVTRLTYDPSNNVDLVQIVNALGRVTTQCQYNAFHQPTTIAQDPVTATQTDGVAETTEIGYTAWGAVSTVTDAANQVSTLNYYPSNGAAPFQLYTVTRTVGGTPQTLAAYSYDLYGRVATSTDANNVTQTYTYNDLDKPTRVTYPDGTYEETDYFCCSLPGMKRDRAGRLTYLDYDPLKRPLMVQDAQGNTAQYAYDPKGNLTDLTDSRGHVTHWDYDNRDRVVQKIASDGSHQNTSYTIAAFPGDGYPRSHLPVASTDELGNITTYGYDADDNLTNINYPHTAPVSRGYDALNRLIGMTDGVGTTQWSYDNLSRCTGETEPFAAAVGYSYGQLNRCVGMAVNGDNGSTTAGISSLTYAFDGLDRATSVTAPEGSYNYSYLGNTGMVSSLSMPNGTTSQNSYDSLERLTGVANLTSANTNLVSFGYGYQAASGSGNSTVAHDALVSLANQTNSNTTQTVNYTYDNIDQLLTETSNETPNPSLNNTYAYDAMGNRQTTTTNAAGTVTTATYSTNPVNEYSSIVLSGGNTSTTNCTYDAAGNTIQATTGTGSSTNTVSYSYDDAMRLTGVLVQQGSPLVNQTQNALSYDGMGRLREELQYTWNAGSSAWMQTADTRFIYDGMNVIQERDGSNNVLVNYTRGLSFGGGIGGLLGRTVHGTTDHHYFYHYDGHGNVVGLSNTSQNMVARYVYDAYGNTITSGLVTGDATLTDSIDLAQQAGNPYRYSTKWQDPQTQLYEYGYRFYNSSTGRWINRDLVAENGGLNLYGFVGNSPTNSADAYGLMGIRFGNGPNIGIGAPSLIIDQDATHAGGQGALAGIDGALHSLTGQRPFADAGYYDPCDTSFQVSGVAGAVAINALIGAGTGGGGQASEEATEGIYEFTSSSGKTYVGQSGNIPLRIEQHLASGKLLAADLPSVKTTEVLGGKVAREVAEQLRINELGLKNLENIRNPIGLARQYLLPINP